MVIVVILVLSLLPQIPLAYKHKHLQLSGHVRKHNYSPLKGQNSLFHELLVSSATESCLEFSDITTWTSLAFESPH